MLSMNEVNESISSEWTAVFFLEVTMHNSINKIN